MQHRFKAIGLIILVFVLTSSLLAGCGGNNNASGTEGESGNNASAQNNTAANNANAEKEDDTDQITNPEPVTLYVGWFDWENFEEKFKEPVEKQFPHITVEKLGVVPGTLKEWIAKGERVPDIMWYQSPFEISVTQNLGLAQDLTPLIEKHGFDLGKFRPELIESMRGFSGGNELHALYRQTAPYALHYNKDIFDAFGVDYPTDGMTWDEAIELAAKVSGTAPNGETYWGLHPWIFNRLTYESTLLDPETDEPRILTDPFFKEYLETFQKMYSVPGNLPVNDDKTGLMWAVGPFNEGKLAMLPLWPHIGYIGDADFEMDIVSLPTFPSYPGQQPESTSHNFGLLNTSEHLDEAFRVLAYITSEEYLLEVFNFETPARLPFSDPSVADRFQLDPKFEGLNIEAYSKLEWSKGPGVRSKYESAILDRVIMFMVNEIALSGKDVAQVLREADELAKIAVAELKAAE
ncbi:ABC transporter substrate-binding protein [Paenibacillus tarimensis]